MHFIAMAFCKNCISRCWLWDRVPSVHAAWVYDSWNGQWPRQNQTEMWVRRRKVLECSIYANRQRYLGTQGSAVSTRCVGCNPCIGVCFIFCKPVPVRLHTLLSLRCRYILLYLFPVSAAVYMVLRVNSTSVNIILTKPSALRDEHASRWPARTGLLTRSDAASCWRPTLGLG